MKPVIRHEFAQDDDVIRFVRERLSWGGKLSHGLLQLELQNGVFWAYVTEDMTLEESKQFLSRYINSKNDSMLVVQMIREHISQSVYHYALGEDICVKREDEHIHEIEREYQTIYLGSDVCYYVGHGNREDSYSTLDLPKALICMQGAPTILTSLPRNTPPLVSGQELSEKLIEFLVTRTEHIIMRVYDDTGYLIWTRGSPE